MEKILVNRDAHKTTRLLMRWREEGEDVEDIRAQLIALIEEELRALIPEYHQRQESDRGSSASALVHEAYLRMVDDSQMSWADRARFYRMAAHVMRQILVDRARTGAIGLSPDSAVDFVAFDNALANFGGFYPAKSDVVELKFFGGLDPKQISEALQVSEKTIMRDWNFAKLWLYRALNNGG